MTKKLEDLFNLPSVDQDLMDQDDGNELSVVEEVKEELKNSTEILNAITSIEKIDLALTRVSGLDNHDADMDDISEKAIESYAKLMSLGMNVSDAHAAKIFESAATMLKTAMEAKDAKVNRKLKTVELQLKKARLDLEESKGKRPSSSGSGSPLDRNELMRLMKDAKTQPEEGSSDGSK